jgi:hypothetical protein
MEGQTAAWASQFDAQRLSPFCVSTRHNCESGNARQEPCFHGASRTAWGELRRSGRAWFSFLRASSTSLKDIAMVETP